MLRYNNILQRFHLDLAFKIFVEINLILIFFFLVEALFWWEVLNLARSSGCETVDAGLLKPGYFNCPNGLWYESLLENFMHNYMVVIKIPLFMLYMTVMITLPISLSILFLSIWGMTLLLVRKRKLLQEVQKFPVLIRLVIRTINQK